MYHLQEDAEISVIFYDINEIRRLILHVDTLCMSRGFKIDEITEKVERPGTTVSELINEYIWVTETRKVELPSSKTLLQWGSLG